MNDVIVNIGPFLSSDVSGKPDEHFNHQATGYRMLLSDLSM